MDATSSTPGSRFHARYAMLCVGIVLGGALILAVMAAIKPSPSQTSGQERAIRVDGLELKAEDFQVVLTGFGAARPLRTIAISAEVSGLVTNVHPLLQAGGVIPAGERLFALDDSDYRSAVSEAAAMVEQSRQTVARMQEEQIRNEKRVKTAQRNRDLAAGEFERVRDLLVQHQVGTQAELDLAEQTLNKVTDLSDEIEKNKAVMPIMILEAESVLQAAQARLARARHQLDRCEVRTTFPARVVRSLIEEGQFIHAGTQVITLADDSAIEIRVPLDARQAHEWLEFDPEHRPNAGTAWFSHVKPVPCTVRWTEAPETHQWSGALDRIEQLSAETRTLTVVVRVSGDEATQGEGFPLVEGMFCSVEVPGRTLRSVFRMPRWGISIDRAVYVAEESRLVTRPVRQVYAYDDFAFVDQGVAEGDILIVTRLGDPLENTLLDLNRVTLEEVLP